MDFWTREDSQIELPTGARIEPDDPPNPNPAALARWVREVRGGILAGAFYLERNMNMAVEAFFLGPLHGEGQKSEVFGKALLSALNFERRTKAAVLIAEQIRSDDVKDLREGLSELRSIRNAMAHNSCWFTGEPDRDGVVRRLDAFINKGKGIVRLDRPLVDEWNSLMHRMIDLTARLAAKAIDPQSDEIFSNLPQPRATNAAKQSRD